MHGTAVDAAANVDVGGLFQSHSLNVGHELFVAEVEDVCSVTGNCKNKFLGGRAPDNKSAADGKKVAGLGGADFGAVWTCDWLGPE